MRGMGVWGGASRVGTVIKFTKPTNLQSTSAIINVAEGDYAIVFRLSGDFFYDWLILGTNADGKLGVHTIYRAHWIGEGNKVLGKITEGSLYSLLNEFHNGYACQGFLTFTKES